MYCSTVHELPNINCLVPKSRSFALRDARWCGWCGVWVLQTSSLEYVHPQTGRYEINPVFQKGSFTENRPKKCVSQKLSVLSLEKNRYLCTFCSDKCGKCNAKILRDTLVTNASKDKPQKGKRKLTPTKIQLLSPHKASNHLFQVYISDRYV